MTLQSYDRFLENSTLLWLINKVPGPVCLNTYERREDISRKLSLQHEQQLAASFAYISAINNDMRKIMAACVEEDTDGLGLTIRFASNIGDLTKVTDGLELVTKLLENATPKSMLTYLDITIGLLTS